MSIKITAKPKKDVITLLSDVDVGFVSLVKHGANWTPWAAIKNEGNTMPGQAIQSILMPIDKDISALKEQFGDQWFALVKSDDTVKFKEWKRYVQIPEDAFQEHSRGAAFKVTDIPGGGMFVCGTLKAAKADALTLPDVMPMDTPVATVDMGQLQVTFRDVFFDKVDSYVDVVRGIMSLNGDAKTRIRTHTDAWKAVDDFVRTMLAQIGDQAVKLDRPEAGKSQKDGDNIMNEDQIKALTAELGNTIKTELVSGFEVIKTTLAELKPQKTDDNPVVPQTDQVPADASVSELKASLAELTAAVAGMKDEVKSLAQKTDALEHATVTQPSDPADPASDPADDDVDENAPFKGMFNIGV